MMVDDADLVHVWADLHNNDVSSSFVNSDSDSFMLIDNSNSNSSSNYNINNTDFVASQGLYGVMNNIVDRVDLNNFDGDDLKNGDRNDFYNGDGDGDGLGTVDGKIDEENEDFNGLISGKTIAEGRAMFTAQSSKSARGEWDLPTTCIPYLTTIPSDISPARLLDSPIMLPNSQLSPTTGSLATPDHDHYDSTMALSSTPPSTWRDMDNAHDQYMKFASDCRSLSCSKSQVSSYNRARSKGVFHDFDTVPMGQLPPTDFVLPRVIKNECPQTYTADSHMDANIATHPFNVNANPIVPQTSQFSDQKAPCTSIEMSRTAEDGYNWRKYGQKQVKGSEYPRSYYKCTQQNCSVKKKVERSYDCQVTEIIYKGRHNHPKPPRRSSVPGSVFPYNEIAGMGESSSHACVKIEGGSLYRNSSQSGSNNNKRDSTWNANGLERRSSTSTFTELSDPLSTTCRGKSPLEPSEAHQQSSTLVGYSYDDNDDDVEDQATHGTNSLAYDDDDDDCGDEESESRKRKREKSFIEPSIAPRSAREPRVVFEIETEVDILEDGYRWRKYGQKVVKGNPNPRSYYKCTSTGCTVRKHVERASHDLKRVITTYEGKHNHDVPAARNASQIGTNSSNLPPPSATQSSLVLPRAINIPKTERQFDGHVSQYEQKPNFNNHNLRPPYLGSKFGSSSIYPMNYLPPQSSMPYYHPYGLNQNHIGMNHTDQNVPNIPCLPLSSPYGLSGVDYFVQRHIMSQAQPYNAGQQVNDSDMGFIKPKEEHNDNHSYN